MCNWQERVIATVVGVYAVVAKSPFPFVAGVTCPEIIVGEASAAVAEVTFL
jgi:hypothetical protein